MEPGNLNKKTNELEKKLSSLESRIYSKRIHASKTIPFEELAISVKEKRITQLKYWLRFHNLELIDKESGLTILHVSICWGDSLILQLLLEHPKCKEIKDTEDRSGLTPLIYAVQYNSLEMVQILCKCGANMNKVTHKTQETALHYAVKSRDIQILNFLLDYDSSQIFVDATNLKGDTALIVAARTNSPAVLQLLHARADYMKGNNQTGRTILHEAVAFSHENLVKEIIEYCPSPVFTELPDKRGDTALMLAIKLNNLDIVKLFIEKPKRRLLINTRTKESILHMAVLNDKYEIFKYLLAHTDGELLKSVNYAGQTPLLLAGDQISLKCLKLLISKGSIQTTNYKTGETLLHCAVKSNNVAVLSELTTLDSLDWFAKQKDKLRKTPYWAAIEGGNHLGIISFLIAGWVDINELNENGESCLFVSAKYGFIKVLKALLLSDKYYSFCKTYSSLINIKDTVELKNAEIRGDIYSTDLFVLFNKEPDPNALLWIPTCLQTYNHNGQNIFHACAMSGNIECLKFVYKYFKAMCLNLNLFDDKSNDGDTPLMLATETRFNKKECVVFFLENGADITSVNNDSVTVLKSIMLQSLKPTDILITVLNRFVKEINLTADSLEEDGNFIEVNFSVLIPKNQPQITTVKLLDDTLQDKDRTTVMQHYLVKLFVHMKWFDVKEIFIMTFIVTCMSTLLLSLYLTFSIVKSKSLIFFNIGRPFLIYLNIQEILLCLPFLNFINIYVLLLMVVLVLIPCASTICYLLFNDQSQTMQELASVCVLMSWLRLLMNSANIFKEISHQVAMLFKVLFGILKYIALLLVIIVSFSLSFFCIFNDYNEFSNPFLALVYTFFVMFQGELDESFMYFLNKHYFPSNSSHIESTFEDTVIKNINLLLESSIFLLFDFVCVIGLLNMLVSLAVRDDSTLSADGEVFRHHLQIQLLNNLEIFFKSNLFSFLEKTHLIYFLGIDPRIKKKFLDIKLSRNPLNENERSVRLSNLG